MKNIKEISKYIRMIAKSIEDSYPAIDEGSETHQAAREIQELTFVLDGILMEKGIDITEFVDTKDNTKSNDDFRKELLKELTSTLELSAKDIQLMAQHSKLQHTRIGLMTAEELQIIYKEAVALQNEGLLVSYLSHLSHQEFKRSQKEEQTDQPF